MIYTRAKATQVFTLKDSDLPSNTPTSRKPLSAHEFCQLGAKSGFLNKPSSAQTVSFFVTKCGVLKTSLAFNFARMAALHNIRTLVIGLDMQGDISRALGSQEHLSDDLTLDEALERINQARGLADHFFYQLPVEELILTTDLPTLFYIPETPELVALEQALTQKHRREYWLKEKVLAPLKNKFDLIVVDCPPNWNQLITNALVASDVLISPLECKITNFRNYKMFSVFISDFTRELTVNLKHFYVPTRYSSQRKLSREILEWYKAHVSHLVTECIREHVSGDESMALQLSVAEYAPASPGALAMKKIVHEIWRKSFMSDQHQASAPERGIDNGSLTL